MRRHVWAGKLLSKQGNCVGIASDKVHACGQELLNSVMGRVPAEAKDMAGKRRKAAETGTLGPPPTTEPPAPPTCAPAANAETEGGVVDPRDKVGLLGKRNAEGVTTPPDENAAKLVLLAKPGPQNQGESDAKLHVKRLQDVATDLATARLNKIELKGAAAATAAGSSCG